MHVNDKVQVDKQERVQDFERFYLLQTKRKIKYGTEFSLVLHLIVCDKYNKVEIDARKNWINKIIWYFHDLLLQQEKM